MLYRGTRKDLARAFSEGDEAGLITLGGHSSGEGADDTVRNWKTIADTFVRELCQTPTEWMPCRPIPVPDATTLAGWILDAPRCAGRNTYPRTCCLLSGTGSMRGHASGSGGKNTVAAFLQAHAPAWSAGRRVTLHLRGEQDRSGMPFLSPFSRLCLGTVQAGRLSQLPLGKALQEYGGAKDKSSLLKLLTPIHAAPSPAR